MTRIQINAARLAISVGLLMGLGCTGSGEPTTPFYIADSGRPIPKAMEEKFQEYVTEYLLSDALTIQDNRELNKLFQGRKLEPVDGNGFHIEGGLVVPDELSSEFEQLLLTAGTLLLEKRDEFAGATQPENSEKD